jgi:biopolymer transport protein ExbD
VKFKRREKEDLTVDLTPLIDVVFLLLIFFMVSTTFTKENHLTIDLPEASGEVAKTDVKQIEIIVDEQGKISINDKALINAQVNTVKQGLMKVSGGDATLPLIITADGRAPHQSVVTAMDAAGQLGFSKLSITTRKAAQE